MALTDIEAGRLADNVFNVVGANKNLIINGAMQVAQRGTQETGVTTGGYRTADRFKQEISSLGTWTIDQSTDAPDDFAFSIKVTCTTANASPAASAYSYFTYKAEAQDLQQLNYGSSAAKAMTLSFWVKSNKTGNSTVAVLQRDNSEKLLSPQYSISAADTWEYKTISIPADTAGVINNDNGSGLEFEFWWNAGSNYTSGSHQTTWSTYSNANRCPSALGVGGATSDYFAITGVQLEVGSVATPFEHRNYGDELARCQRYYFDATTGGTGGNVSWPSLLISAGGNYISHCKFPVTMRTPPSLVSASMTGTGNCFLNWSGSGSSTLNTVAVRHSSINTATIQGAQDSSFGGAGYYVHLEISNSFTGTYAWSAEL